MKIILQGTYRGERIDKVRRWKRYKLFGIEFHLPHTEYVLVGPRPFVAKKLKDLKEWIDEIKDNMENL